MPYSFAGRYGPEIFMDSQQNLMKVRPVTVYNKGTLVLATLYSDRTKGSTAANPFTTDSFGNGTFFAEPGEYDVSYGGVSHVVVVPMDPVEAQQGGPPSGAAGGELGGNYPNPTLSAAKNAEIAGKVAASLFDANSILIANVDNTPIVLPVPASTIVARLAAGGIVAATPAQIKTLLAISAADVSGVVASAGHTANSVPVSTAGTLADLVMGASTILARLAAGNIVAATPAQIKSLLAIAVADVIGAAPTASPTFTGTVTAADITASGVIQGASLRSASGIGGFSVGAFRGLKNTAGPPTTGTWQTGDFLLDSQGISWQCTTGGTPGTWITGDVTYCTDTTRPTTGLFVGRIIFETNTLRRYFYNGSAWEYLGGGTDPTYAFAYRNAAYTLTALSNAAIPFDTEAFDNGNNFSTATGLYTCPYAGNYHVAGRFSVVTAATNERFIIAIRKNAADYLRGDDDTIGGIGTMGVSVAADVQCAAGDTLGIGAFQVSGTGRALEVGAAPIVSWGSFRRVSS